MRVQGQWVCPGDSQYPRGESECLRGGGYTRRGGGEYCGVRVCPKKKGVGGYPWVVDALGYNTISGFCGRGRLLSCRDNIPPAPPFLQLEYLPHL